MLATWSSMFLQQLCARIFSKHVNIRNLELIFCWRWFYVGPLFPWEYGWQPIRYVYLMGAHDPRLYYERCGNRLPSVCWLLTPQNFSGPYAVGENHLRYGGHKAVYMLYSMLIFAVVQTNILYCCVHEACRLLSISASRVDYMTATKIISP